MAPVERSSVYEGETHSSVSEVGLALKPSIGLQGSDVRRCLRQAQTQPAPQMAPAEGSCTDDGHPQVARARSRSTGDLIHATRSHLAAQLECLASEVLTLARTSRVEERGPWSCYDNVDKVDYASGVDVEAMVCNTPEELRAVQRRVEEMGYSGFAVVKGMACLKKFGKQLGLGDLEPIEHKNSFWIYNPALATAEVAAATKIQKCFRGKRSRETVRKLAEATGFPSGVYVLSDESLDDSDLF